MQIDIDVIVDEVKTYVGTKELEGILKQLVEKL